MRLENLFERLRKLEARLRPTADKVSGVKVIREFLATGRDAYEHLGKPAETGIRWHLFFRKDDENAAALPKIDLPA